MKYTASELRELLKSRDTALRMKVIRMCDALGEPDRTQLLCIAIKDRSSYLAADAAVRLVARAEPISVEPVLARFLYLMEDGYKRDPGCYIRANLAAVLGNMHALEAVPALRDGLRAYQLENCLDTAGPLRSNCAMALATIPFGDPVMDLAFLLFYIGPTENAQRFFDRSSQFTAVQALVRLEQAQSAIALYAKLSDPAEPNNALLAECMSGLVELKHPRAAECLVRFLDNENENLAVSAAIYLLGTMEDEYLPAILAMLPNLKGDLLEALLMTLSNSRSDGARDAVAQLRIVGNEEIQRFLPPEPDGHSQPG